MRTLGVLITIVFGIVLGKILAMLVVGIPVMMLAIKFRSLIDVFYWLEAILSAFFIYSGVRLGIKVSSGKDFRVSKTLALAWVTVIASGVIIMTIVTQIVISKSMSWSYILANGLSFLLAGIYGVKHQLKNIENKEYYI